MKKLLPLFLLVTNCVADSQDSSDSSDSAPNESDIVAFEELPDETVTQLYEAYQTPVTNTNSVQMTTDMTQAVVIRLKVCAMLPLCFDTDPISGQSICAIKWSCPAGY